jgi:hypothetical protein
VHIGVGRASERAAHTHTHTLCTRYTTYTAWRRSIFWASRWNTRMREKHTDRDIERRRDTAEKRKTCNAFDASWKIYKYINPKTHSSFNGTLSSALKMSRAIWRDWIFPPQVTRSCKITCSRRFLFFAYVRDFLVFKSFSLLRRISKIGTDFLLPSSNYQIALKSRWIIFAM